MIMTVKSPHLQDESSKLETQESQRERGLKNRGQEPGESMVEFQTDKQAEDLERGNISVWVWRQEKKPDIPLWSQSGRNSLLVGKWSTFLFYLNNTLGVAHPH